MNKFAVIKTIAGNLIIVDEGDENAPLVTLHNEYNNLIIANKIINLLGSIPESEV